MAGVFWFPTKLAKYVPYGAGWAFIAMCYVLNVGEVFEHHFTSQPFPIGYAGGEYNFEYSCIWRHGVNEVTERIEIILWTRSYKTVRMTPSYLSPIQLPSWVG
jgi:hypothetical protein